MEIFGKGLLYFYQETSFLIGDLTNRRTNMFLPLAMSWTLNAFVLWSMAKHAEFL